MAETSYSLNRKNRMSSKTVKAAF